MLLVTIPATMYRVGMAPCWARPAFSLSLDSGMWVCHFGYAVIKKVHTVLKERNQSCMASRRRNEESPSDEPETHAAKRRRHEPRSNVDTQETKRTTTISPDVQAFLDEIVVTSNGASHRRDGDSTTLPPYELSVPDDPAYDIDQKRLAEWIDLHPAGESHAAAALFAPLIQYVSFREWRTALAAAVAAFIRQVSTRPDHRYVLAVQHERTRSDYWVAQIVLRMIAAMGGPLPTSVGTLSLMRRKFDVPPVSVAGERVLLVDDAMYSGMQMGIEVARACSFGAAEINVVVGYTTQSALAFVREVAECDGKAVPGRIWYGRIMPTIGEQIVDPANRARLSDQLGVTLNQPTTYFQFNMPDHVSIPNYIVNDGALAERIGGGVLAGRQSVRHRFLRGCEGPSPERCPPAFYKDPVAWRARASALATPTSTTTTPAPTPTPTPTTLTPTLTQPLVD
jgi:hypothetical protein